MRRRFRHASFRQYYGAHLLNVQQSAFPDLQDDEVELGFVFRKQRFCWNEKEKLFRTLQFPDHVSRA